MLMRSRRGKAIAVDALASLIQLRLCAFWDKPRLHKLRCGLKLAYLHANVIGLLKRCEVGRREGRGWSWMGAKVVGITALKLSNY